MRQIFIDTNVVTDFLADRGPFSEYAAILFQLAKEKKIKIFISAVSFNNIYYILRKAKGHDKALGFLRNFFKFVNIAGVNSETISNALYFDMKDFEDAVQTEAAIQNNIKVIITRDKKDFENSGLQIFSPDEYLNELKNT